MTEDNPIEFTRDQAVGIQSLIIATQTVRECFLRFKDEPDGVPDAVRNYVLETAQAYRDFINEELRNP